MKRRWSIGAVIAGVLIGYTLPVAFTPAPEVASPIPLDLPTSTRQISTTAVVETPPTTSAPGETVYLVWATGGLPSALVEGLAASFSELTVVKGDVVELAGSGDSVIPLDAIALDPLAHAFFDPSGALAALGPGTVALGTSSAELRGAGPGDLLMLAVGVFSVAAVVSDYPIGAAEIVFDLSDTDQPVATDRYALVRSSLPRQDFEDQVRGFYDGPAPLRIRAEGETPWLRHGDAVLPQVFIKEELGEFSYTRLGGSTFAQDQVFVDQNIVTSTLPLIGEVRCHRVVSEMLAGAMNDLVDRGLAHLVEPAGFAGCWFPRFINAAVGVSSGVSRHAWGGAVDLNAGSNPVGSSGNQDPRLVAAMARWGFTWGGEWLVPDPMHFEFAARP